MATDAVPLDLLRSSLDDFKLKFGAVDDPCSPSKAWLVHVHDRGDEKPAIYARADGYDSPSVKSSPSTWKRYGVAAIVRRVPRFKRVVQLAGYQSLDWICEGAAELLDALPAAVQHRIWRGLPDGTQLLGDGLWRWMLAVFEIGNANVAGSSLRCKRWYPITGEQAKTIFAPASGLPADADWYATLPDFAEASVQAIAILQSWLADVPKQEAEGAVDDGGTNKPTAEKSASLRPSAVTAWSQYQHAIEQEPTIVTDDAAYDWLVEDLKADGIRMPRRDSWKRSLRRGREFYGQQKNGAGIGNETRSVVSAKRLDTAKRTKADHC